MAEGKPRRPEAGAQLEELSDQLARFLQHADQLLEDWARFGAQVRTTVDQEVGRIEQAAAEAGERATKQLAGQVDRLATERVERAIGDGLKRLKAELDRAGRATAVAPPPPAPVDRRLIGLAVAANALLLILLVVTLVRGTSRVEVQPARTPDPGVAAPSAAVLEACRRLALEWNDEAAELVWPLGSEACGGDAPVVARRLHERLAPPPMIDAGPPDAAPPLDARKPGKPR